MKNIAIIDIGSNSMRIIIYKIFKDKGFKAIATEKYPSKLAKHLDNHGNLSLEGINLTINTLKMFKNICEINNVSDTYIIATEAIRKSKNNKEFLPMIKKETGFDITILSGFEEAFLGYLAVKSTFDLNNALIVDIGGSSMEISLMKDREILNFTSLPLGAIPLTKDFNFYENISNEERESLEKFLFEEFSKIPWLKDGLNFPIIGVSSAFRTIGKIHKKSINYPLDITHNFKVSFDTVNSLYKYMLPLSLDEKIQIKGLAKEKADIFVASLGAINTLMTYCASKELIISEFGIKEGLLFKILNKENHNSLKPLEFSLNNIMCSEDLNTYYRDKTFKLCKAIYKALELDSNLLDHKVLYTSCSLLNIGFNISLDNVHKHSFYMILNSNIYGLSPKEILMCAYIVALSKKQDFKLKSKFKELLLEDDIIFCKRIATLLNLARKINILENNNDFNIEIKNGENNIYLNLPTGFINKDFLKETIENNININFKKYFNKDIFII